MTDPSAVQRAERTGHETSAGRPGDSVARTQQPWQPPVGHVGPPPAGNPSQRAWIFSAGPVSRLWLIVGQLVAGVLIGVGWRMWAPGTEGFLVPNPHNVPVFIPAEAENQVAGDGRFLVLSLVVGLLTALLAWYLMPRRRGALTLIVLVVGALASSLVAHWVGNLLSSTHTTGSDVRPALVLHAWPILFVQPLVAAMLYTAISGFSNDPELGVGAPVDRSAGARLGAEHAG